MNAVLSMLLPATLASGAACIALSLRPGSPARWRLAIAALGFLAWVIPWPLLVLSFPWPDLPRVTGWLNEAPFVRPDALVELPRGVPDPIAGAKGVSDIGPTFWLSLMLLPGLAMFAADIVRYRRVLAQWRRLAMSGEELRILLPDALRGMPHLIRLVPGNRTATATGLWRGTIWIEEALAKHAHLKAALLHECVHVARYGVLKRGVPGWG